MFGTFVSGILAGFLIRSAILWKSSKRIIQSTSSSKRSNLIENLESTTLPGFAESAIQMSLGKSYKMALCVRTDLKMKPGKIASQCAHAAVLGTLGARDRISVQNWLASGQKKIVLKVDSLEELHELESKARDLGMNTGIVHDAGKTQVAPMSETVLAIGPNIASDIDQVTGNLKLFS
jgi:peptidyl-tRNA hydrolase, PTH2 family